MQILGIRGYYLPDDPKVMGNKVKFDKEKGKLSYNQLQIKLSSFRIKLKHFAGSNYDYEKPKYGFLVNRTE